jgi:hypothetical protein
MPCHLHPNLAPTLQRLGQQQTVKPAAAIVSLSTAVTP